MYMKKTIISGAYKEVEIYPFPRGYKGGRGERLNESREEQIKLNQKNVRKELTRKLRCNFTSNDYFVTLTYTDKNTISEETANKRMKDFLRKLRNYFKKQNKALKYIYVTEWHRKDGFHHHIVINADLKEIRMFWQEKARVTVTNLYYDESGLEGLANYMLKQQWEKKNKRKYSCSKGLKKPVIKVKRIKKSTAVRKPKASKGFRIVKIEYLEDEVYGLRVNYTEVVQNEHG